MFFGSLSFSGAKAAIFTATYTGTIAFAGFDTTGEFGNPSQNLEGLPFVATFRYDLNIGDRGIVPGRSDTLVGGFPPSFNFGNPLISASLSINKITQNFFVPDSGFFFVAQTQTGTILHRATLFNPLTPNVQFSLFPIASSDDITSSLESRYNRISVRGGGSFLIFDCCQPSGEFNRLAQGQFRLETFSVSSSIPEPSSWLLMVLGFGLIGYGLRNRNHQLQKLGGSYQFHD